MSRGLKEHYLDYFFEFTIARAKLTAFRFWFFLLIGLDGILQLPHAPRYGAGDFNVSHFAWLEALLPAPERSVMVVIFLLQAYLGGRIALGVATRTSVVLLTALYGYAYFVSQLDSYQHHYLVFLLLAISCFIPWNRPSGHESENQKSGKNKSSAKSRTDSGSVRSWAVRLVLVQVAIVYLFAALTKCESLWLDGTLLDKQLPAGDTRELAEWLGFGISATAVVVAEGFLALALISGRLHVPALIVGIGLHAGIEFGAGFQIGIFSYYMFAFYLLLVPDRLFDRLLALRARMLAGVPAKLRWSSIARKLARPPALIAVGLVSLVAGWLLIHTLPLAEATPLAILTSVLAVAAAAALFYPRSPVEAGESGEAGERRPAAATVFVVHLAIVLAMTCLPETGERVGDYYKYWAGSARRLNDWDQAGAAYRQLAALRPGWAPAHYYLGQIAHRDERPDDALEHYRRAQRANPADYRSFLQAAALHHRAGRGAEALAAAESAARQLAAMRQSSSVQRARQQAQRLVEYWSTRAPTNAP